VIRASWSATDWRAFLTAEIGAEVEVRYGRARKQVVRVTRRGAERVVHLNAVFADAPPEVRDALARWLRSGRRARAATRRLDDWIDQRMAQLHVEAPLELALRTRGSTHDLAPLAAELRAAEFAADFGEHRRWPRITWGRAGAQKPRRSLRLGSFEPHARVVRIHPVLDQPAVPAFFVRYVLFHELLHAALDDLSRKGGRRVVHGPRFNARERAYAETEPARRWERAHIDALIRSARTGKPLPARAQRVRPIAAAASWIQRRLFD
jgi:hypothetical protein